jgi:uncharacterized protein (DUF1697 family)
MARQVALLRGINVGGNKKVPMATLREVFDGLGYTDVRTYVNSGNVVFDGPKATAKKIEQAIEAQFGFDVAVVLRTRDELAQVVADDPFGDLADHPARYFVLFADRKLDAHKAEGVDTGPGEQWAVCEREIHLWLPEGVQGSKVLKGMTEKRFGATLTSRNRRTVGKLLEMADEPG